MNGGRWQVSSGGGTKPLWARSGRELFYFDASGVLTTVPVTAASTFNAGNPTKVFDTRYFSAAGRTYDVSPDGKKFLMIKNPGVDPSTANAPSATMTVVLNWFEELKAKVPVK